MSQLLKSLLVLVVGSLLSMSFVTPTAQAAVRTGCITCEVSAGGSGSNIDVDVVRGTSQEVTGRGNGSTGKAPGRTTWTVVHERMQPTCSGNGLNGGDILCNAALTCPADNLVRFWVWHQVEHWEAGPPERMVERESWKQEPGTFCLGADDPGITPIGVVIAQVQSGFQSLPLPKATPQIQPAPSTLVNVATRLDAGSSAAVTISTEPLAGIVVDVTATPKEWRWSFGDGRTATTTVPRTTHVYERARDVEASVTVVWGGTFRIRGTTEDFPIRSTARVTSAPVTVDVREARSELVRD